ncbi:MAG: hypothetical protein GEU88_09150 [Solirubrobacterales bacterium]|nr:hypothetical protein [Solirubrobacterales bacterium]
MLFAPTGTSERHTVVVKPDGGTIERTDEKESTTLLEDEPGRALRVVAVAFVLSATPLALGRTRFRRAARTGSAVLLGVGALIGGFSVGLFYLPSASAMALAAARSR